jgi:predicted Fe-S protein YdhL (DUF1289 family)
MTLFEINVFGQPYTVRIGKRNEMPSCMKDKSGYTDRSIHEIGIWEIRNSTQHNDMQDLASKMKETLRHEIVHAALFESGLLDNRNYDHEEIADWLSIKAHALHEIMADAERMLDNAPWKTIDAQ